MCLHPFAWTNVSSGKNACFAIWAHVGTHVGTKFFNLSHHFLSMDGWPGDATFFLWGQPVKIIRNYSAKKRSSPLDFIFVTCVSASWSHFFGWWSWTYVVVPFCKGKCIFSKKTCVLQFGRALTKNVWIRPIMSYLWMIDLVMRLFARGANLWRSSASIQPKKVQPLGFYFWPLRLGLLKSLFWLVKLNICVCTLLHGQMYLEEKTHILQFGRVDTKFLNSSHHVLSVDDWPGDAATFCLWGQPLKITRMYSAKKRSSPLDFIFDTCASASSSHFLGWWSWTYVVVPFCKDKCIFSKKHVFCNLGACWHTILEFVPSCPICGWSAWWCDFLPVGPTFEDHPQVFSQKRSSPLDFIFDTCASASWSHFFGWWSWTYVFVPFLQSHVKNHTPSNNHGTFFSWGLTYRYVLVNSPPWKLFSCGRTFVHHRKIILKQNYFPGFERTHGLACANRWFQNY